MTALEIILLMIGIVCIATSYIFFDKKDKAETPAMVKINAELSEKQKQDIKTQIAQVLEEQTKETSEKTEVELEKLSNQKIQELGEYSETVLSEINKTHDKVMFLYDMLNEKNKEVNATVRDLSSARDQLSKTIDKSTAMLASQMNVVTADGTEKFHGKQADSLKATVVMAAENSTQDISVVNGTEALEGQMTETAGDTSDITALEADKSGDSRSEEELAPGKNEMVLKLSSKGMDAIQIAKELGIGTGEVKLILELFEGKKA